MNKTKSIKLRKSKKKKNIKKSIKKSSKKKGGQLVPYDFDSSWHRDHLPLWVHNYDCVPNTFYLLKYCDEENARYLASVRGDPYGITNEEILNMITQAYDGDHWFQEIEPLYNLYGYINVPNTATLITFRWLDESGHALAVVYTYSKETGEYDYYILCGQSRTSCLLRDYIEEHKDNIYNCTLLMSDTKHECNYEVTKEIIDKIMRPPNNPHKALREWYIVNWFHQDGSEYDNLDRLTVSQLYNEGMVSFIDSDGSNWYSFTGWKSSGWSGTYTIDDAIFTNEWYPLSWGDGTCTWTCEDETKKFSNFQGMVWFVDNSGNTWNKAYGYISEEGRFGGWIPRGWDPDIGFNF